MTLGLVERLKNSDFILERRCVKTLFYLGNKSTAQSAQLLTRVLQNLCSKRIKKISEKGIKLGSFLHCSGRNF